MTESKYIPEDIDVRYNHFINGKVVLNLAETVTLSVFYYDTVRIKAVMYKGELYSVRATSAIFGANNYIIASKEILIKEGVINGSATTTKSS